MFLYMGIVVVSSEMNLILKIRQPSAVRSFSSKLDFHVLFPISKQFSLVDAFLNLIKFSSRNNNFAFSFGTWDLMGCAHECWGSWPMSLWGCSWLSLKGHGKQGRFLRTGRKQMPPLFSRKKVQELQPGHHHLDSGEGDGTNNPGNYFQTR